jgi:hypothetical protein
VAIFLFFGLKLDNIQTEISRKIFNRAQNSAVEKKTLGKNFKIIWKIH